MSELTQPEETFEDLPAVPPLNQIDPEVGPAYPYDVALIIDNIVYSVFNVEGQQAAQFLSQPIFVQFSNNKAKIGWIYNPATKEFSSPLSAESR
jgi:hypothetical protein